MEEATNAVHEPTACQRRVADFGSGTLLVTGASGSGRSEALALRLGALVEAGERPEHVLVVTRSRPARAQLRERAEVLVERPHDELWIGTWGEISERCCATIRLRRASIRSSPR